MLSTSLSSAMAMAITVAIAALAIGNKRSAEAFLSQQLRSVSVSQQNNGKGSFAGDSFSLHGNSDSNQFADDDEHENADFSCDMNTDPLILDWDLHSLLSSDPSVEAKFIPLMQVYDAAASAAEEKAQLESDSYFEGLDDDNNTPSHAPSILPSKTTGTPIGPVQSLGYEGSLSPSVAPYRMFVREYSRDMGHNGRFTVFGDDSDEDTSIDEESVKRHEKSPTLQSDVVFSMDDPLAFIRDNLSYGGNPNRKGDETVVYIPGPHTTHGATANRQYCDGRIPDNGAITRSSPEQLKFISQVLHELPIAQIHAGTHIDQGDLDIELTYDTINNLLSFGLLSDACSKDISLLTTADSSSLPRKALYRLRARDLDIIHSVLSRAGSVSLPRSLGDKYLGSDSKGLKDTLIRLIDIAVRSVREYKSSSSSLGASSSLSPHLVLMTYSATSNVLVAALSEWKKRVTTPTEESDCHLSDNESTNAFCRDGVGVGVDENSGGGNFRRKIFSEQEAELLLHKALTVVTISSTSQGFVDGPAYIHVSMDDDPLASTLGVTRTRPEGGGKDAVILQALSPYLIDDEDESDAPSKSSFIYKNDAHNIDSCVIQYLSLVRRINGVTSFREMYNVGIAEADSKKLDISSIFAFDYRSVGQLIIPPRIDCELIPAMIRATGGERWLWNPEFQLGEGGVEGFYSPLPSLEYAQAELENQLGYNSYDEIVENCCRWK